MTPMLTVVVITKNEEHYLPRLLSSLKKQTFTPSKIIVSDAHSTDRTREIAAKFGVDIVDGGLPSVGRNRGAAQAQTEFILFLDADVELHDPYFLEKAVAEMQTRRLDIGTCDVLPISNRHLDHWLHKGYNAYARLLGSWHPHAPGFCIFSRRDLHEKIGGFDEEIIFCEDHDYAVRACKQGKFGFLHHAVPVSVRRLDRDGRLTIVWKYLLGELHLWFLGPIRHNKFHYTFGYDKKKKDV
ncbi:TPA: glycosyl transferase family 2 [Candidatus Uhrbacteria bacterium]|uniref:Glycosyl transferase family 2 n=2 Tax=Candidatus Uhriibacteriota TaxID=1752732 RepID=A0A0G1Q7J2_9BACT|nr:MAG: Glycosyl transferase family 2 [Candidatus Uhrbacteria bacterium GW2011_GWF2_46_218]KKU41031.1 MAG: Glycosyl transferase family 2 [Candidatus Uhrbacteria bacterium GW2011_GWE2_46_68]HBK33716.1 glycosyl transferase family 2 [Candidatus Uhrbacteria bacterium]HCB19043.1 glycosyl transferase family 2 [Candidatus Uhrbacteria bacterium]